MSKGYGLSRWELWRHERRQVRRKRRRNGEHLHLIAVHRHPDWHGHCRHLWNERETTYFGILHSCAHWHVHVLFRHRHTPTGR